MNPENYDEQGTAQHYQHRIDLQHQMESIWGTFQIMTYCEMSAFCYRMRLGKKVGNPVDQDLIKAKWFEKRAKFYHDKIKAGKSISGIGLDHNDLTAKLEKNFLDSL